MISFKKPLDPDDQEHREVQADHPEDDVEAGVHGGHCCRPEGVWLYGKFYPPHHAIGSPCQTGVPCCDHKWTGGSTGHCGGPAVGGCHQTFYGMDAWDSHFKLPPENRGDLRAAHRTPEEMEAGGMWAEINQFGTPVWHGHWNKEGVQKRRPAETIKKERS